MVSVKVKLRRPLVDALKLLRVMQQRRVATTAKLFMAAWAVLAKLNACLDVIVLATRAYSQRMAYILLLRLE